MTDISKLPASQRNLNSVKAVTTIPNWIKYYNGDIKFNYTFISGIKTTKNVLTNLKTSLNIDKVYGKLEINIEAGQNEIMSIQFDYIIILGGPVEINFSDFGKQLQGNNNYNFLGINSILNDQSIVKSLIINININIGTSSSGLNCLGYNCPRPIVTVN
jgi:hypothetical protein